MKYSEEEKKKKLYELNHEIFNTFILLNLAPGEGAEFVCELIATTCIQCHITPHVMLECTMPLYEMMKKLSEDNNES